MQASTGLSPYEMLFGLDPVVPPAQRVDWGEDVDWLDDSNKAFESWIRRGLHMKEALLSSWRELTNSTAQR